MIYLDEMLAHRSHVEHLFSALEDATFQFSYLMPDSYQTSVPKLNNSFFSDGED